MFVGSQKRVGFFVDALVQVVLSEQRRGDGKCGGERKHAGSNSGTHWVTSEKKRHLSTGRRGCWPLILSRLRGRVPRLKPVLLTGCYAADCGLHSRHKSWSSFSKEFEWRQRMNRRFSLLLI